MTAVLYWGDYRMAHNCHQRIMDITRAMLISGVWKRKGVAV